MRMHEISSLQMLSLYCRLICAVDPEMASFFVKAESMLFFCRVSCMNKEELKAALRPLQKYHSMFLFMYFLRHMSFLGDHWYPCFEFLVTSPLGFKARVDSALFAFLGGECNVYSPRSTSGATHADLLAAGSAGGHLATCISRGVRMLS